MKYLIAAVICLFCTMPGLCEIKEFDPTRVIIDTDTAEVIYIPRELDYQYAYHTKNKRYENRPNLKELIFGRKGCNK